MPGLWGSWKAHVCKGGGLGALADLWSEAPVSIQDQNQKTFFGQFLEANVGPVLPSAWHIIGA